MLNVEICMGSSCYSRGNSKALELIEAFIEERGLDNIIKLSGKLCLGNCSDGPNIIINGNLYKKTAPECTIDLLNHYLETEETAL